MQIWANPWGVAPMPWQLTQTVTPFPSRQFQGIGDRVSMTKQGLQHTLLFMNENNSETHNIDREKQ